MASGKAEIRKQAPGKRAAVPPPDRLAFAQRLATLGPRLVVDFAPPNPALVVSLFSAIGDEPDMMPLARALHDADVTLALPVTPREAGGTLVFRRWTPDDPMVPGPMGTVEPRADAEALDPDLLFVPLAAFDRRGHRIGYGKGHYDRALARLRSRKAIRAIGVAFAVQEQLFIPSEPHDEALDLVVTDSTVLLCGS